MCTGLCRRVLCSPILIHEFFFYPEPAYSENHLVWRTTSYKRKIKLCVMKLKNLRTNYKNFYLFLLQSATLSNSLRFLFLLDNCVIHVLVLPRHDYRLSSYLQTIQLLYFCSKNEVVVVVVVVVVAKGKQKRGGGAEGRETIEI